MNAAEPAVIDIQDLTFSFDGPPVLEHVSLAVPAGEFLGLVGPNAGGKSTLLKIILGLLEPDSGAVRVLGKAPSAARSKIGYCPQYARFQRDFPISVSKSILQGRLGASSSLASYNKRDYEIVDKVMLATEIDQVRDSRLSTLSGGQLQRVLIARALACEPEILILDEPTANLDMRIEEDFFSLLKKLNETMTIILVSHDVGFISEYVTRVGCLNRTLICHQTAELTGETIEHLYGSHVTMIRHEH